MDYHFEHNEYGLSCSFRPWCCSYVCIRVFHTLIYALKQCVYVRLLYDKRWLTKSSTVTLHRSSLPVRHGARWSMTNKSLYPHLFFKFFLNEVMLLSCLQLVLRITGTVSFRDQEALHLSWYASSVSFSLFGGAASIAAFATRTATFIAIKPSGDTRHTLHISEYPISLIACSWVSLQEWMQQENIIC